MSEQLKHIVSELNKPPFNKGFNLISFDELHPDQLLQILNDVFAEIDQKHAGDIREEDPQQMTIRMLGILRILKYKPPLEIENDFRQGLVKGHKYVIYPVLLWLLQRLPDLKKRAYLARYLLKLEVPNDVLGDSDIRDLYDQYEQLIEEFKTAHKECESYKKSEYSTAEQKKDMETMEEEKDIILKRIDRFKRKVEGVSNLESLLLAVRALRKEKNKEQDILRQKQKQQAEILQCEQRIQRMKSSLAVLQQSSSQLTPESLIQRLEDETNVTRYIATEKLPKELEKKQKKQSILQKILSQPAMGQSDLSGLQIQLEELNKKLMDHHEKRVAEKEDDNLSLFRQQAVMISRKKNSVLENLNDARQQLQALEDEYEEKKRQVEEFSSDDVLRGDDFKLYLNKLKDKSKIYKIKRSELGELKAEFGVLSRTDNLLQDLDNKVREESLRIESKHGITGFNETREGLDEVNSLKVSVDQDKGQTLEEISSMVVRLNRKIEERKSRLAPIISELRPLRRDCQEIQTQLDAKKEEFDSLAAGLESSRIKMERELSSAKEDYSILESKFHLLEAELEMLMVQQIRVAEEVKLYVNSDASQKRKSLRDKFLQKIAEADKLSKQLKEKQKAFKENYEIAVQQRKLWEDLKSLLQCKIDCYEEAKRSAGQVVRESRGETLVLS